MHGHEQVGAHLARFFHARVQRQVVVAVARQHRAHAGLGVDHRLQAARDGERDVLLQAAAAAARARILPAVPGVDDHGRQARDLGFGSLRGRRARGPCAAELPVQRVQRHQRIGRVDGVQVEHQAMAVVRDRLQGEHLRLHLRLEVEHHARHAGAVARHTQRGDVRVARGHLVLQLRERGACVRAFQVEHQALGTLECEQAVVELGARFESDARVVARRPDARGDDFRLRRAYGEEE